MPTRRSTPAAQHRSTGSPHSPHHAAAQPSRRGSEPASNIPVAGSRRMISMLHGPSRSPTVATVAAAREFVAHRLGEAALDDQFARARHAANSHIGPETCEVQRGISAACCGSSPKSIIAVSTCRLTCT